jgi:hypothetical protein
MSIVWIVYHTPTNWSALDQPHMCNLESRVCVNKAFAQSKYELSINLDITGISSIDSFGWFVM